MRRHGEGKGDRENIDGGGGECCCCPVLVIKKEKQQKGPRHAIYMLYV